MTVPTLHEIAREAERRLAPAVSAESRIGRAERYQAEWAATRFLDDLDHRTRRMVAETLPHVTAHRSGTFTRAIGRDLRLARGWARRRLVHLADLALVEQFGPRRERWRLTALGREVVRILEAGEGDT